MISVVVLTKDSARTLLWTLRSLAQFDEVIVYDTGSKDATLEIAKRFGNVRIVEASFEGFGRTRNRALFHCKHPWILHIDSDEVLSPELTANILALRCDEGVAYALERANYFWGKRMKTCSGWYPDWVVRLYHKDHASFLEAKVHERLDTSRVRVQKISGLLHHVPYLEIADLITKMQNYTTLFAEEKKGKESSSLMKALFHAGNAFLKSLILKRGILAGREGFILSLYQAHTAFYKYVKLLERSSKPPLPAFLKEFEEVNLTGEKSDGR